MVCTQSLWTYVDTLAPFFYYSEGSLVPRLLGEEPGYEATQKVQETWCKQCYHSPLKGLSTTVTTPMQTIPLHLSETHSQPTTNITAAAVAGTTTTY